MEGLGICMHARHGTLYLVLTFDTGMSDNDDPVEAYLTGAIMDLTYCYICYVLLSSAEAQRIHDRSVVHIMRSLKLMGKPIDGKAHCHVCGLPEFCLEVGGCALW